MTLFDQPPVTALPLRRGECDVFVGTCSWADRGMVSSDFYPPGTKTNARARLEHYTTAFPAVEVDAAYHALQPPERARNWLEWTPPSFRFGVKAFAWMTGHESDPKRLPKGIALLLPAKLREGGPLRADRVPEEVLTAAWDYFASFTKVLGDARRLGYVLFQFPKGKGFSEEMLGYMDEWRPYLRGWPVAVEIRHKDWLYERNRDAFFGYLREHGYAYVIPDIAQTRYLPPPDVEATSDLSVVRFHGRNPALVERRVSTDRAYDYLYSREELEEWAGEADRIAARVRTLYLMFNNHARGQAARNGREMVEILESESR